LDASTSIEFGSLTTPRTMASIAISSSPTTHQCSSFHLEAFVPQWTVPGG
jgi:hypothetical protein